MGLFLGRLLGENIAFKSVFQASEALCLKAYVESRPVGHGAIHWRTIDYVVTF